jgi:hypothetical protein
MIVYTNGCSHTDDLPYTERYDVDHKKTYAWPVKLMDNLSNDYKYIRNLNQLSETNLKNLSQNDMLISDAVSGAGNDHIFHSTLESLGVLFNSNIEVDYLIIQWSGPSRREHILPDGKGLIFVNPSDNLDYHLKFEPMASTHSLHYMYTLQELLKSKGIKYYFFNYIPLDDNIKKLSTYKQMNFNKFINFEGSKETIFNGLVNYIIDNKLNNDSQGHANPDGNTFISSKILEKIKGKII